MDIFHSAKDLRVVICTQDNVLLDTHVKRLEAFDHLGQLVLDGDSPPMLAALIPGDIVVHRRDGTTTRIEAGWGSLTSVGNQVRIATSRGRVMRRRQSEPPHYDVAI